MAQAVTRVVHRCNDAKESRYLDLSDCLLIQVPDAVYHLLRNTELQGCNLSKNSINKLSSKFTINFAFIKDLDLSFNQLCGLPQEFEKLVLLEKINLSHNTFVILPEIVFTLPKLITLNASHNYIIELEVETMKSMKSSSILLELDLQDNPLSNKTKDSIKKLTGIKITFDDDY